MKDLQQIPKEARHLLKKLDVLKKDDDILAITLFGSFARNEPYSDIDVCIVLNRKLTNLEMSKKRLKYQTLVGEPFDIQIFQQLPSYIRMRILKEGVLYFCRDLDKLYDVAYRTIKDFVYFERYYRYHLEAIVDENR
ncbi:MAG: nucleotidyltransferase domain-containing protein [Candidatus Odinarchaeota archaeon]|nr:nucleotidyltransferase domain-containing protein [Candidatus Odinarchaeota archaeon]